MTAEEIVASHLEGTTPLNTSQDNSDLMDFGDAPFILAKWRVLLILFSRSPSRTKGLSRNSVPTLEFKLDKFRRVLLLSIAVRFLCPTCFYHLIFKSLIHVKTMQSKVRINKDFSLFRGLVFRLRQIRLPHVSKPSHSGLLSYSLELASRLGGNVVNVPPSFKYTIRTL